MLPPALANSIIVLVSVVFAVNFAAQFAIPGYQPDPAIYGVFMAIVGGAFALKRAKKDQDKP